MIEQLITLLLGIVSGVILAAILTIALIIWGED